jgi:hypothetical protein
MEELHTMPQFVLRLTHPPDQCPLSNSKVRSLAAKGAVELPKLAEKHGIRFVLGPTVLASEHEALAVIETDKVENIDEFILQSSLAQWNAVRVSSARPLSEAMKELERAPSPLY